MPQTFPFTDPNPGWADGKKLFAADMVRVSANAAQAADGLLWSDVAIAKNFSAKTTITNCGNTIFWDAFLQRWITAGASGGAPVALASADGRDDWLSLTIPAGTNWNATASGASNGAGTVLLGGGGGSATASKIRQSSDGGVTWNARNTVAASIEAVNDIRWFPLAGLFVAGHNSFFSTNVETSPDGITWTQRTAPNTDTRRVFAAGSTAIVCTANTSSNKAIYSSDGVSWSQSTLPATATWTVAWIPRLSIFMALAPGFIATSPDGATWSTAGLTAPFPVFPGQAGRLCSIGRVLVANGSMDGTTGVLSTSIDGGATWRIIKSISSAGGRTAAGDNQIVHVNATSQAAYASIRGGV